MTSTYCCYLSHRFPPFSGKERFMNKIAIFFICTLFICPACLAKDDIIGDNFTSGYNDMDPIHAFPHFDQRVYNQQQPHPDWLAYQARVDANKDKLKNYAENIGDAALKHIPKSVQKSFGFAAGAYELFDGTVKHRFGENKNWTFQTDNLGKRDRHISLRYELRF